MNKISSKNLIEKKFPMQNLIKKKNLKNSLGKIWKKNFENINFQ